MGYFLGFTSKREGEGKRQRRGMGRQREGNGEGRKGRLEQWASQQAFACQKQ